MRRALWLLAVSGVLSLLVGLSGCGGGSDTAGPAAETAAKPDPKPPPPPPEPVPTPEKIAFQRDAQVWTMYTNGTGAVPLTSEGGNGSPCWRGDGQEICFVSNRTGKVRLFAMNNDGSNQRQVSFSDREEDHEGPHWCWADPNRITFGIRGLVDAPATTLAVLEMNQSPPAVTKICYPRWGLRSPTWSPNGSRILYEGENGGHAFVVEAEEGATPSRVLSAIVPVMEPAWSPTGTHVAYTDDNGLWVVPVDDTGEATGQAERVAYHGNTKDFYYSLRFPTWAPDGSHLAYWVRVWKKKGAGFVYDRDDIYKVQAVPGDTPQYLGAGLNPEWSPTVF